MATDDAFKPGGITYPTANRLFGVTCQRGKSDQDLQNWSHHVLAPAMEVALEDALKKNTYTTGDVILIVEIPHSVAGEDTNA